MMRGIMGQQNSCKTLIGVHEMHVYMYIGNYTNYVIIIYVDIYIRVTFWKGEALGYPPPPPLKLQRTNIILL